MDQLLVDGYNVIYGWEELRSLASLEHARHRLIDDLASFQAFTGIRITVVFDSSQEQPPTSKVDRGVRVIYAPPPVDADGVIEALARGLVSQGAEVGVVTSDRLEGDLAFGMRCLHWTVARFAEELARARREMGRWTMEAGPAGRRASLRSHLGEDGLAWLLED